MNAAGMFEQIPKPTRDQIIEGMRGNICRCCNYANLLAAVEWAAELRSGSKTP
jgi:carbon-monoxide dehydrogenase small subunit